MDTLLSVSAVENQAGHPIAKMLVFITNKEKNFTYHKCRKNAVLELSTFCQKILFKLSNRSDVLLGLMLLVGHEQLNAAIWMSWMYPVGIGSSDGDQEAPGSSTGFPIWKH